MSEGYGNHYIDCSIEYLGIKSPGTVTEAQSVLRGVREAIPKKLL